MSAEPEVAPVRAGEALDWPALEARLRAELADLPADPMSVLQFPRGSANLTYRLSFGDLRLVLRRPPFGKTAPGAHDMGREHRILSRIWRAYPRAPRAYLLCEDVSVIGAPFVVQEYRGGGEVIFDQLPPGMVGLPDLGLRLTRAMADALADMHTIDIAAAGLSDLGKPEGFVARQMSGWRDRWARAAPAPSVPAMDRVADALEESRPATSAAALIHNDYKLNNCQFRPDDPDEVITVFDWDMATLGDPLIDVGILLNYWASMKTAPGLELPPKEAFAQMYADRAKLEVEALRWYEAFACWRMAITVQQLGNRYRQGDSHDERLAGIADRVPEFADRAAAILAGQQERPEP